MSHSVRMVDVQVAVPVPTDSSMSSASVAEELRRLWLIEQVRHRRISVGKAAELAGMPRAAFMQALGEHGVPVIDYDVEDLERELRSLGLP